MSAEDRSWIERGITVLCSVVLWISTTVIFVILVANTVLRYTTGSSLQWANEVPELLFPWLVMAGVVLAAAQGAHIATVFLMQALPAGARRIVAVLTWLVVAGLYFTVSWATYGMLDIVHDEKSPILHIPGSVTYGCVMGGMLMMALLALLSAKRAWTTAPQLPGDGDAEAPPAPHW
jgi:TRAP-type C4-dicarboxylate transport system permease small subunit